MSLFLPIGALPLPSGIRSLAIWGPFFYATAFVWEWQLGLAYTAKNTMGHRDGLILMITAVALLKALTSIKLRIELVFGHVPKLQYPGSHCGQNSLKTGGVIWVQKITHLGDNGINTITYVWDG